MTNKYIKNPTEINTLKNPTDIINAAHITSKSPVYEVYIVKEKRKKILSSYKKN